MGEELVMFGIGLFCVGRVAVVVGDDGDCGISS